MSWNNEIFHEFEFPCHCIDTQIEFCFEPTENNPTFVEQLKADF